MHRSTLWLLVVALCGTGWVSAAPPSVTQVRLACIARDANARISARVEGHPTSVRVYFRQENDPCGQYYVDMHPSAQDPALYTAILPLVAPDATSVIYQVRVQNGAGKELVGEPMTVPVSANCVAPALTPEELHAANGIVLGLTQPDQHGAPCRFKCNGIVSVITVTGELKPNEECRLILAGRAKPWYQRPGNLAAIGAGAIGAGLLAGSGGGNGNSTPPSPARP